MDEKYLEQMLAYMVRIRRALHEYPEVEFDLPRTMQTVSEQLRELGISYTTEYGKSSLVAEIGKGEKILALRADMDALPIVEKVDIPFCSKIPGMMHACGHDSHTAILLGVAKYLKEHEDQLNWKMRLIFQPSEEGAQSGAKVLVDNGVMDGVDHIICTHCEASLETGLLGICKGDYQAACVPLTIRFYGRTSHATIPEAGIDAVAMAAEAYYALKEAVEQEAKGARYIWSVGKFAGGHAHNVIADYCEMAISYRFYDMDFQARMEKRTNEICQAIAAKYGGKTENDWHISTGPVHNNVKVADAFEKAVTDAGLQIVPQNSRMSSEDFGWYLTKAPGALFRFGIRNEAQGCVAPAHRNDFKLDENGMLYAFRGFVSYIMSL